MTVEEPGTTEQGAASRRAMLLGAGAVGATALLAACADDSANTGTGAPGGGAPAADPTQPPPPPPGGDDTGGGGGALAKTGDIEVGGGKVFAKEGVVVTQPKKGDFKAFSATCTHQQCPVAEVAGGTINCTCHGSKFSIEDGSVKQGPARKPLAEKDITVEGKSIKLG
jgi:Rieske Fe-S protein